MPCPDCEMAKDLERHARLVALGLEEAREVELAKLTPEERLAVLHDEALYARLLDRIERRRYSLA